MAERCSENARIPTRTTQRSHASGSESRAGSVQDNTIAILAIAPNRAGIPQQPARSVLPDIIRREGVDGRNKSGHDERMGQDRERNAHRM
jgi:hypothetical protein